MAMNNSSQPLPVAGVMVAIAGALLASPQASAAEQEIRQESPLVRLPVVVVHSNEAARNELLRLLALLGFKLRVTGAVYGGFVVLAQFQGVGPIVIIAAHQELARRNLAPQALAVVLVAGHP